MSSVANKTSYKNIPDNQSQSKMMKPKKIKRFIESPVKCVKTKNRFLTLSIEECNVDEIKITDQGDREADTLNFNRNSQNKQENKKISSQKVIKKGWK